MTALNILVSGSVPDAEVKLYGLVRDQYGTPKFDGDPREAPPQIKAMLNPGELEAAIERYKEAQA